MGPAWSAIRWAVWYWKLHCIGLSCRMYYLCRLTARNSLYVSLIAECTPKQCPKRSALSTLHNQTSCRLSAWEGRLHAPPSSHVSVLRLNRLTDIFPGYYETGLNNSGLQTKCWRETTSSVKIVVAVGCRPTSSKKEARLAGYLVYRGRANMFYSCMRYYTTHSVSVLYDTTWFSDRYDVGNVPVYIVPKFPT